MNHFLPISAH